MRAKNSGKINDKMKRGLVFSAFFIILILVNLSVIHSVKLDSNVKVDNAVYEKLGQQERVRVIVRLHDKPQTAAGTTQVLQKTDDKEKIINYLAESGEKDFKVVYKAQSINGFTAEVSASALEELKKDPSVKSVKVELEVKLFLQDSVPLINGTLVWPVKFNGTNLTGNGQTVCIVDTGINYSHADLGGCLGPESSGCRVLGGFAFNNPFNSSNKTDVMDDNGHGTHVAGIVGANGSLTGVAPGVNFVSVKACGPTSACGTQAIIDSINWCVGNASRYNISVISMSLGGGSYTTYCDNVDTDMTNAIDSAIAKNITVIVATGNDGSKTQISWPACIRNSTAVGGTTKSDAMYSSGNRNNITTLLAPGESITSTWLTGTASGTGTSMATPHVSGAVALLKQYKKLEKNDNLTTTRIKDVMNRTGKQINDAGLSNFTYSRLNVYAALVAFDETAPNLVLNSPQNTTYATNISLALNFTVSDNLNLSNCWYSLDSAVNVSLQNCANITFNTTQGNHRIDIYANDSAGNTNVTNATFNVNQNLVVTLLLPSNSTLNSTNDTQTFSCNATAAAGLQNVTLYIWDSANNVFKNSSNKSGETYNQTNFSYALPYEGTFKWNCRIYDNLSGSVFANSNYTITFWDYNISGCRNITLAGNYKLNKSIQDRNTTSCITITTSDVEVDCQGYQINGTNQSDTAYNHQGINASTSDPSVSGNAAKLTNITIKNCNILNWTYGIILVNVFNSTITNTNISNSTFGVTLSFSSYNNLTNISTFDITLYGAYVLSTSQKNFVNNSLFTRGTFGIVLSNATSNIIDTNTVYSNRESGIHIGASANFNIIKYNNITANLNYGIDIQDSNHNILDNNWLVSNGAAFNMWINEFLNGRSNNTISNATQKNNANYDLNITDFSIEIDESEINSYLFSNSTLVLKNSSYARINLPNVTQNGTNLSADVVMRSNYIFVNSSNAAGLNKSANLSFYGLTFNNPRILKDSSVCPASMCAIRSYTSSNGTLIFNVTGFSAYSAEDYCGNSNCESGESCSSCSADCGSCSTSSSSSGGGGGGGGAIGTTYLEGILNEGKEINRLLRNNDKIKFTLRNNEHNLTAKSVTQNNATFELNSTSLKFAMFIGESRKFNLTDDKFYDLLVTLKNVSNFKANLSITAIFELIHAKTEEKEIKIAENVTNITAVPEKKVAMQKEPKINIASKKISPLLQYIASLLAIVALMLILKICQNLKEKQTIEKIKRRKHRIHVAKKPGKESLF